jgi:hypothetical protein
MRTIIIITGLFFLSFATYAQQERQMQKSDQTTLASGTIKKPVNVQFTSSEPRQMVTMGSKPVTNNGKPTATQTVANSPDRKMTPLNPNAVVKRKN